MESPYEYYDNKLGVKMKFLITDQDRRHPDSLCLVRYQTLRSRLKSQNNAMQELRRSCYGSDALVLHATLDLEIKEALVAKFKDPIKAIEVDWFSKEYMPDYLARSFYESHRYGDNNTKLGLRYIDLYTNNASVLNTVLKLKEKRKQYLKALNVTTVDIWQALSNDVNAFRAAEHDLPTNKDSLRRKAVQYQKEGYNALISGKFGMQNALLVTDTIESIIISLYCLPNKPYVERVHELYLEFLNGEIEIVNVKTGEIFDRKDCFKKGKPIELSVPTIWNYITAPKNELIIKKYRNGAYDFNHKMRPHVNRTAPVFSMSKISLDDRDIMHTKLHDGSKVMAYYAFDVMSGAMIGIAHSKSKNHELYLDCIRNMFLFTTALKLGVPLQMEVEQHLVSDFKEGLMKAGNLFPFVRWCNPTNSQEKGAEHLIGIKKYGVEKDNNQNVGRHYSRRDSNRVTLQKIFDAENNNYKEAKASFEEIVANEMQEQIAYNNQQHSNKKKYPGQTRLEVFMNNINPDLPKLDPAQLARYIGNHTATSIRRSQYVTVQYGKYQLTSPQVLKKLKPNNYNVDAYYMPNEDNEITEVYIYQEGHLIDACKPVPTFNTANAEWTEADVQGYKDATKYISEFDKMVRDDSQIIQPVTIMRNKPIEVVLQPEIITQPEYEPVFEYENTSTTSQRNRANNDL